MEKLLGKFFDGQHMIDTLNDKADKIEIIKLKQQTAEKK